MGAPDVSDGRIRVSEFIAFGVSRSLTISRPGGVLAVSCGSDLPIVVSTSGDVGGRGVEVPACLKRCYLIVGCVVGGEETVVIPVGGYIDAVASGCDVIKGSDQHI